MPYISNDGIKIYYEVIGADNKPALLMNHGNGNCIEDWKALGYIEILSSNFQLILVDARGFGRSDKPQTPDKYTPEMTTKDFILVLDKLEIEKCHYFGNSRGGSMGYLFKKIYPERFKSFCLCSSQPYGSKGPKLSKDFIEWLEVGIDYFVEKLELALKQPFPPKLKSSFLKNNPKALIAANTLPWPDYSSEFSNSNSQKLLLIAGQNDPVCTYNLKLQEEYGENIQLKILQGFTHAQVYWNSSIVAPLARDFFIECEQDFENEYGPIHCGRSRL
jgi:pimeloyl-ACP methyl ester carboxylesterase